MSKGGLKLSKGPEYSSRFEVYLHSLKFFVDDLTLEFNGKFVDRDDMFNKTAYLIEVDDNRAILEWFTDSEDFKRSDDSDEVLYIGETVEEIPGGHSYYVQIIAGSGLVYIGLKENDPPIEVSVKVSYELEDDSDVLVCPLRSIKPGSLEITIPQDGEEEDVVYTDNGGLLFDGDDEVGSIDYVTGIVLLNEPIEKGSEVSIEVVVYQAV